MQRDIDRPRILFVTPEISYLPEGMNAVPVSFKARAGELADFSSAIVSSMFEKGADVYVALPDYRTIFNHYENPLFQKKLLTVRNVNTETKVHLAQDRVFFYKKKIYSDSDYENMRSSLAFQREVINTIVPRVQPDLIHCNDWMTGLIPAMARRLNIPCLFTIHNFYNFKTFLSTIEDRGIDAALFWQNLFFERQPLNYEETRSQNPVDFLASGIFAAHFVNTNSPRLLKNIIQGGHPLVDSPIKTELTNKVRQGCGLGILHYPDASQLPETDTALIKNYDEKNHISGKKINKLFLQERLGLIKNPKTPLFFWPSALERSRHSIEWVEAILYGLLYRYQNENMQIIVAGDGTLQGRVKHMSRDFHLKGRVAVCGTDNTLYRSAYGGSDFILMPSEIEPAGLEPITGLLYGALPIVHNAGKRHDYITPFNLDDNKGNGFLFNRMNADGLFGAVDEALKFYSSSGTIKSRQIRRIMKHSRLRFNHTITAEHYIALYEKMMKRPFINQ